MGRMQDQHFKSIKERIARDGDYLQPAVTVRSLVSHCEAIEAELQEVVVKYGQSEKAVDRLTENVIQLQKKLEEERDAKKVPLPKEVVEAIDVCRKQDNVWGVVNGRNFSLLDNVNQALRVKHGFRPIKTIAEWVVDNRERRDTLIEALVNGYTIEELPTVEDKIKSKMIEMLKDEDLKVEEYVINRIAYHTALAMREVLAEDRQEE